jgi:hypothetical protein
MKFFWTFSLFLASATSFKNSLLDDGDISENVAQFFGKPKKDPTVGVFTNFNISIDYL